MQSLTKTASRLTKESSFIFALLLIAAVGVLLRDPKSWVGATLAGGALFVGIMGFMVNFVREAYEDMLKQKDQHIEDLTKERRSEIKHAENMRKVIEERATKGWTASHGDGEHMSE